MEKIVAIFVACSMDLLYCHDLPFIEDQHVFQNMDDCKMAIVEIIETETEYRKENGYDRPIVMGKCKWWLDERHIKRD